jgi:hypothetical protein
MGPEGGLKLAGCALFEGYQLGVGVSKRLAGAEGARTWWVPRANSGVIPADQRVQAGAGEDARTTAGLETGATPPALPKGRSYSESRWR